MNMGIRPILSALLRNSAGAILVSLQIAITLAIVVNAVYLTTQRVQLVGRPSGIDDQNIFSFNVEGFEKDFDFIGMVRDDMALLRQMPGVIDAAPIHQVPLSGSGSSSGYYSLPDKKGKDSPAAYYRTDDHGVTALGVKLADGKNFDASMVEWKQKDEQGQPPVAVVSRGFAEALFPGEKNLAGRNFYDDQSKAIRIVGVIDHMQGSWVGWDKVDRTILVPRISEWTRYIVRTQPGEIDRVYMAKYSAEITVSTWQIT